MSVIFLDGFDFYTNGFGPGGRKWDQGSEGLTTTVGRFAGFCWTNSTPGPYAPAIKTFATPTSTLLVGQAMNFSSFTGFGGSAPNKPILVFKDGNSAQCSMWLDPNTNTLTIRTGMGNEMSGMTQLWSTIGDSGFVPPLTLWFYLEVKVVIGNPGSVIMHLNGTEILNVSGVQTQQTGNATTNRIEISSAVTFASSHFVDDFFVIDCADSTGSTDFLGEVRIQTKFPDADGFETDFLRSQGSVNANNANTVPVTYVDNGKYNYSGTVGALDLYSIGNFTVSGTIFAVQENLSFRKDDVGNRNICPLLRTASVNYEGTSVTCFSDYTYTGTIWEANPSNTLPWILTDLNVAEFGIKIKS